MAKLLWVHGDVGRIAQNNEGTKISGIPLPPAHHLSSVGLSRRTSWQERDLVLGPWNGGVGRWEARVLSRVQRRCSRRGRVWDLGLRGLR